MIEIKEKKDCCGCSACVQRCPKSCISLKEDNEGFLYPIVDKDICIDCGLCEKVCPVIHQRQEKRPMFVYAAKNNDEIIRKQSSSGGFFTLIAENIINEGGVVFGARFDDNYLVKHDYSETIEGLSVFRASKYVQSRLEDNYQKAEKFLKQGRKVLFSGTPCQIAGLKRYLCKEYDNLLTVDFVCHGVPSPGVWRKYLKETIARMCDTNSVSTDSISMENVHVESISFRDKSLGWKNFSFAMTLSATTRSGENKTFSLCEVYHQNSFMKGFLKDLYLRPSCYFCSARSGKSGSDITIGDLWGAPMIIGDKDDDRGCNLVLVNKDISFINNSSLSLEQINYQSALAYNPSIEKNVKIPLQRYYFYSAFKKNINFESIINKTLNLPLYIKVFYFIKSKYLKVLCRK